MFKEIGDWFYGLGIVTGFIILITAIFLFGLLIVLLLPVIVLLIPIVFVLAFVAVFVVLIYLIGKFGRELFN